MWKLKENYEGLKELMLLEIGNVEEMSDFSFNGQIVTFAFNLFSLKLQSALKKEIPEELDFQVQYNTYDLVLKYSNREKILYSNRSVHSEEVNLLIKNAESIFNNAKETLITERDKHQDLKNLVNKVFDRNRVKFKDILMRDVPLYTNKKILEEKFAPAVTNTINGLNIEIVMGSHSFKLKNSEGSFLFENFHSEIEIEKSMYKTIREILFIVKSEMKNTIKNKFFNSIKQINPNITNQFVLKYSAVIDVETEELLDNVSYFQISSDSAMGEIESLAKSFSLFYKFKKGYSKEFKQVAQSFTVDVKGKKFSLVKGSFPQSCTQEMFDILVKQLQGYLNLTKEIKRRNFIKINLVDFRIGNSIRMKVKSTFSYEDSTYTLIEYRTEDNKKTKHVAIQDNFEISKSRYKRINKRQKAIS